MKQGLRFSLITGSLYAVLVLCLFGVSNSLFAQQQIIKYSGNWGPRGFNIEQQNTSMIQLTFSVDEFYMEDMQFEGKTMKTIGLPGVFLPNNAGAPNIAGTGRYIAIPEGAEATLEIIDSRSEVIHNVEVGPAFTIPKETEDGLEYHKDMSIYGENALYPKSAVSMSKPTQIRGVDMVMLGFTPFQYNPVTKDLIVYKDIRVRITLNGGNGTYGETRLRSRWFDPLLEDLLLNPQVLPTVNYNKTTVNTEDVGFEYLIITPNDPIFQAWADTIIKFRTRQGIITGKKTLADIGGNTELIIENYINNAYATWSIPPVAILILGDYGTNASNTITSPIWDAYCVSDNIYGDVDGNSMPDIVMARITAQNETQLEVMIHKFMNYEKNPPTSPYFYSHPISALGWQTERWFQLCSEVIGGFWANHLGKTPVRINAVYIGNPAVDPWSTATNTSTVVSYFGPTGLNYIPTTPQGLSNWTGGNAAQINTAINAGSFMLQHRDHGMETGWGEPSYVSSDIDGLTNTDLSFIMSVNCLTGKYNYSSEVFAEKFHRHTANGHASGALGLIAASEVSYSFVNDAYIWGVYDNLWPDFMPAYGSTPAERGILPAFGNAAGKFFLEQSSWPYNTTNKEVTYNLFHHHGDAFLNVYSEVPQSLTVAHAPVIFTGVTSFDVSANLGALICLSLNGQILGTGTGLGVGVPTTITIPGNQLPPDYIHVVVTLQNYLRYEGDVQVIPPAGPYVIKNAVAVNDPTGNNNSKADYGENINLTIDLKNVGIALASNVVVTIQSTDANVTITDATENYGDIAANAIVSVANGFALTVADNVEDGHFAHFTVSATNGTVVWTSSFNLLLNAPALAVGAVTILDPTGNNNGRLDPGETATITLQTKNNGNCDAVNVLATLVTTDPLVTITNSPIGLNTISTGSTVSATFNVEVSPLANIGNNVMFTYDAVAGNYSANKVFFQTIGLVSEDWETGNFLKFDWQKSHSTSTGSNDWIISNAGPYEGIYCAKSGAIPNSGWNDFHISMNVLMNDSISFYRKVSSESGYDYLEFYIDATKVGSWAGTVSWGRVVYQVPAGSHTFKWRYMKDGSQIGGSDCAWVDYILFPPVSIGTQPLSAVATAMSNSICIGTTTQLNATVTGGTPPYTYLWTPATGLNFTNIANPFANPSATTTYSVTVKDSSLVPATSTVTITVNQIPNVSLPTLTPACLTWAGYTLSGGTPVGGTYSGTGISNNIFNPTVAGVGTTAVTYTFNAGACTNNATATIYVDPCAGINEQSSSNSYEIYPNPNSGIFTLSINTISDDILNIKVVNTLGMLVYENKQLNVNGRLDLKIDLGKAATGIYYLNVDGKKQSINKRFMVN